MKALLLFLVLTLLLPAPGKANAEMDMNSGTDTVMVDNLAHIGFGMVVGFVPDLLLHRVIEGKWDKDWKRRLLIDGLAVTAATELYESQANLSTSTQLGHAGDGLVGTALMVGASLHWSFR
jgi:hypothetical protein